MDKILPFELVLKVYQYLTDYDRFKFNMCSRRCRELVFLEGYRHLKVDRDNLYIIQKIINQSIPVEILDLFEYREVKGMGNTRVKHLRLDWTNIPCFKSILLTFNPKFVEKCRLQKSELDLMNDLGIKEKFPIYEDELYKVFQYEGNFVSVHTKTNSPKIFKLQIEDAGYLKFLRNEENKILEVVNSNPQRDILKIHECRVNQNGILYTIYRDKDNNIHRPRNPARSISYYYSRRDIEEWYNHGYMYKRKTYYANELIEIERFNEQGKLHSDNKKPSHYLRDSDYSDLFTYHWHEHGVIRRSEEITDSDSLEISMYNKSGNFTSHVKYKLVKKKINNLRKIGTSWAGIKYDPYDKEIIFR